MSQSTVSHHLKVLNEVGFALVEREGTYSRYRLNEECVQAFPSAADVVMGRPAPLLDTADEGRERGGKGR
ncbi:ArsR family transcriptional regulator [Streptomyces sp. NPDC002133]|uniref:ArsR/SmtB family transcription factor n=1 Tax=Streptomyces sp. NPDC002133 TaxID=3154409 RepID=UPI003318AC15